MEPIRVILLPGSVLPAQPAYGALIEALGPDVHAVAKDLELYAGDDPPAGWSLDTEIDGVLREARERGWETFHLAGYSGGGAAALAFAAKHPGRLLSLTLLEAAWAGNWDWSPAHAELWKSRVRVPGLFGGPLGAWAVVVALPGQRRVSHPAVGVDDGARSDGLLDERAQRVA